jgi:hypothetical protein
MSLTNPQERWEWSEQYHQYYRAKYNREWLMYFQRNALLTVIQAPPTRGISKNGTHLRLQHPLHLFTKPLTKVTMISTARGRRKG